jgi:signal peptidase I
VVSDSTGLSEPAGVSEPGSRPVPKKSHWLRESVIIVVVALVIATLIRAFLAQAFFIPSGSMENTLAIGDRILVEKVTTEFGSIQRGDIVVFEDPGGWLPPSTASASAPARYVRDALQFVGLAPVSTNQDLVKRVIGLPGDHVVCCNAQQQISVNGVTLDESSYLYPNSVGGTDHYDVTVPANTLWVLGDNRQDSEDSAWHYTNPGHGSPYVPEKDVIGRAFVIIWPIKNWGTLGRPATFSQPGLNGGS